MFDAEELAHGHLRPKGAPFVRLATQELENMNSSGYAEFTDCIKLARDNNYVALKPTMLNAYEHWLRARLFPPRAPGAVTVLAGNGHEKVLTKVCAGDHIPHELVRGIRWRKTRAARTAAWLWPTRRRAKWSRCKYNVSLITTK